MITGEIKYVVIEMYADNSGIVAAWGPFPSKDEADRWEGLPSKSGNTKFETMPMHEAPQWFDYSPPTES